MSLTLLKKYRTIILLVIIAILVALYLDQCRGVRNDHSISAALNDTLTKTRDTLGRETAKISMVIGSKKSDLLNIKSKDKQIIALQRLLKETKRVLSATVLSNVSRGHLATSSNIRGRDTIRNDSIIEIYPEYWTIFNNEWEDFNITANKDTIEVEYKVFNKYEITQAYEKREKGLFKKKVPVITITNLNPNTETKALRSFAIKPKPRKFSIGVGAYYGFSVFTGVPTAIIGGGIQYNLLGR